MRLLILRSSLIGLILLKLIFIVIDILTNYHKIFFTFNEFSEKWELDPFNLHLPKIILSTLANALLMFKFPSDSRRGSSKQGFKTKGFKIAMAVSFFGEVLFETESKDILTLTSLSYSLLYEDLFNELYEKPQILWFEIIRLGSLLIFGRNLWRTVLLLMRDMIFLTALARLKDLIIEKVFVANQQMDLQSSMLSDFKKLIDEAPSAFFILRPSSSLQIDFMNEEARNLGRELEANERRKEEADGLELNPNKASTQPQSILDDESPPMASFLQLPEENYFMRTLASMAKSPREDPERLSNIPLSEPPVCYDALVKVIDWLGQPRLMVELRRSNYQHIRMTQELLGVIRTSISAADQKFSAVLSFVDAAQSSNDAESLRAASVLALYKHSMADYIRIMQIFHGVLFAVVKEDRGEKVLFDVAKLEQLCTRLGKLLDVINKNRMNAVSITIAAMFKKGFSVNVGLLELLLQYLLSYMVVSNTGNKFSMKIAAKQVNDAVYSLEIAVEGFNSNSFCAEVFSAIFSDDTQALIRNWIPRLANYGTTLYMLHYLRKAMGLKWKCYGGATVQSLSHIKTPNQFSRLAQLAATISDAGDIDPSSMKETGTDCSLKLMALLEKSDLMSPEIDPKFKKVVYQYSPKVRLLTSQKLKAVTDIRFAELLVNRRTLESLGPELDALVRAYKGGKAARPIMLDSLAAQSFAEDFLSVAMRASSKGIHPLDDQILTDPSLGAVEEDLMDWSLALATRIAHIDSYLPSPKPQQVSSEMVSSKKAKKKSESARKESLAVIGSNANCLMDSASHSSEQLEMTDQIAELGSRRITTDNSLQIRSCETQVRLANQARKVQRGQAVRFEKYANQSGKIDSHPSDDDLSIVKASQSKLVRQPSSPRVSEAVHRHSSIRDPGTIKTVSSIDVPAEKAAPVNVNLNFIRGHGKLM